jgi:hypothetical protein
MRRSRVNQIATQRRPKSRRPARPRAERDEGSALILALVMILVGTMMVLPVMSYTMSVTRANRVSSQKADRTEAVKGGLRAALYDPVALYQACAASGYTAPSIQLAVPPGLNIASSCLTTDDKNQVDLPSDLRYALATTQVGSGAPIPPPYVALPEDDPTLDGTMSQLWCTSMNPDANGRKIPCGKPYGANGATPPEAWTANTSVASEGGKIFLPPLPPFSNWLAFRDGYSMVSTEGPCTVFFPGKYTDDVVITGTTPVYFASGIYYFEKTLRISGDAHVVVGAGSTPACVESDAVAVGDPSAPADASSGGVGGTFVFGATGRLVLDTTTSGSTGISLKFNRRLVDKSDPFAPLNDISILSVNGEWNGTATVPLVRADQLYVPVSQVSNGGSAPSPDPWTHRYQASTLLSPLTVPVSCAPPAVLTPECPIIDINLTTAAVVDLKIPGYVAVPQGSLSLAVAPGAGVDKTLTFGGGILAAQMAVSGEAPEFLQLGLLNPIVQKTFKITTETVSGTPKVVSIAQVQVNETGGYAINSWSIVSG